MIIREPTRTSLSRTIKEREGHAMSKPIHELRQYGVGAQILLDLGIRKMILLTNTERNIVGLDGYGISLEGQQAIPERFREQLGRFDKDRERRSNYSTVDESGE